MGTELNDDWAVEDPNEEWYNPTKGPKGTWMPEGKVILELLERIQKEKVFELKWKCPGRRPPPSSQPAEEMETEADFDEEEVEEEKEEDKSTAFGEFDFDDALSEVSTKITPRRTPGSAKASRPEKRVACMDNVLNKILTQRKLNDAARANKGLGIRGRRTPIYSTGSPRSRFSGSSQLKSSPLSRPFLATKSPISSVPKPVPTPSTVLIPTPMEVDQDSNKKGSAVAPPKEVPQTLLQTLPQPVIPETSAPPRPVSVSESKVVTSVTTPTSSPNVKAKPVQPTPSIPATSSPSRPTVPPLRLSVSSALQSQIHAAVTSASQNAHKEYREPIPKLLLKIPPPSANQPATSMLLPPGYSRSSPGNKNKSSPSGQKKKSPNQSGNTSQHGSPVLKHRSKTPPLYQNAPKTPPVFSSGQKTPPLHHGGNKSPAFNQSAPKTPPAYQNTPPSALAMTSGSKTPPGFQNRSKTPPGGVSAQRQQLYQSGSKTPPIYPPRSSPFLPHNFPPSQSVRPPPQGHIVHPTSLGPRGNHPNTPAFTRQPFPPRTTPSPLGSPRGQQSLPSPSRISPQSPLAHSNPHRSPFYPNFPPVDQPQSRPPFHQAPQQRQPRPRTPPAYHTVVSRAPPSFPPPPVPVGMSSSPNTPIHRAPIQAPGTSQERMANPATTAEQNRCMGSNSTPAQHNQPRIQQFQRTSPPANEQPSPAHSVNPQQPAQQPPQPPASSSSLPSPATMIQHAKVPPSDHKVPPQLPVTTSVPVHHTSAPSKDQQPPTQMVNTTFPHPNSHEISSGVTQEQKSEIQQASVESEPPAASQQTRPSDPDQHTQPVPQQGQSK